MANREALRDLQARLAERLKTAQSEGTPVSWLAVRVAGRPCLFPLEQAGEICNPGSLQAVPFVKPWFLGVINVRGNLSGVVDLAAFLGWSATAATPTAEASVVTLNPQLEVSCGLLVDALAGLRSAEAFAAQEAPAPGEPACIESRRTDAEGVVWQEINLRALAQSPQFLSIGM